VGRRLPELRAPAQQSEPANDRSCALTRIASSPRGRARRSSASRAIYRVLKPHLATVYERHLAVANPCTSRPRDGSSLAAWRRSGGTPRPVPWCSAAHRRDPALEARAQGLGAPAAEALTDAGGVTGDVEAPLIVPPALDARSAVVAQDLVALPAAFDPQRPGDLAAPLEAHRRRWTRRSGGLGEHRRPRASWPPSRAPRAAASGCRRHRLRAAGAPPGGQAPAAGSRRVVVLQERWVVADGGWRDRTPSRSRAPPPRP
jgi:hypothetical protein